MNKMLALYYGMFFWSLRFISVVIFIAVAVVSATVLLDLFRGGGKYGLVSLVILSVSVAFAYLMWRVGIWGKQHLRQREVGNT